MGCNSPGATHHLACDCRERKWAERLAEANRALYGERERVVRAELRASSLSRELLTAIQARDSYRASAELRVGLRREFEELLGLSDTTAPETFEAGLVRLRALLAAERRAEEADEKAEGMQAAFNATLASERAAREKAEREFLATVFERDEEKLKTAHAESRAEKAERERDAYRHEWNVSSRQQGAETRARYAAEAKAERLAKALRHCARELQYVLDADPCEHWAIHQSGEAKACVALAESLLGPMRGWPEGPNAGMLALGPDGEGKEKSNG